MKKSDLMNLLAPFADDAEMEVAGSTAVEIRLTHEDGKVKVHIDPKRKKRKKKRAAAEEKG